MAAAMQITKALYMIHSKPLTSFFSSQIKPLARSVDLKEPRHNRIEYVIQMRIGRLVVASPLGKGKHGQLELGIVGRTKVLQYEHPCAQPFDRLSVFSDCVYQGCLTGQLQPRCLEHYSPLRASLLLGRPGAPQQFDLRVNVTQFLDLRHLPRHFGQGAFLSDGGTNAQVPLVVLAASGDADGRKVNRADAGVHDGLGDHDGLWLVVVGSEGNLALQLCSFSFVLH
jgi:hypothetical protein